MFWGSPLAALPGTQRPGLEPNPLRFLLQRGQLGEPIAQRSPRVGHLDRHGRPGSGLFLKEVEEKPPIVGVLLFDKPMLDICVFCTFARSGNRFLL